jgi:hypothetical protein
MSQKPRPIPIYIYCVIVKVYIYIGVNTYLGVEGFDTYLFVLFRYCLWFLKNTGQLDKSFKSYIQLRFAAVLFRPVNWTNWTHIPQSLIQ